MPNTMCIAEYGYALSKKYMTLLQKIFYLFDDFGLHIISNKIFNLDSLIY